MHWPKNATTERPAPRWTPCGVHPEHEAIGCPSCEAERDMTPEDVAAAAAECRRIAAEAKAAAQARRADIETKRQEATR